MLGNIFIMGCFYVTLSILFKFVFCHGLPKGEFVGFQDFRIKYIRTSICNVGKP